MKRCFDWNMNHFRYILFHWITTTTTAATTATTIGRGLKSSSERHQMSIVDRWYNRYRSRTCGIQIAQLIHHRLETRTIPTVLIVNQLVEGRSAGSLHCCMGTEKESSQVCPNQISIDDRASWYISRSIFISFVHGKEAGMLLFFHGDYGDERLECRFQIGTCLNN